MNKIDFIRKKKLLSYNAIAEKTGLTAAYVYMLAKGKRKNPSLEVMQKIACALESRVEFIFQVNQKGEEQRDKAKDTALG